MRRVFGSTGLQRVAVSFLLSAALARCSSESSFSELAFNAQPSSEIGELRQGLIAPTVTQIYRAVCNARARCQITLTGSDFITGTNVFIDDQPAPRISITPRSIVVVVPVSRAGSLNKWVDVRVENSPAFSTTLKRAFLYYGDDVDFTAQGQLELPFVPSDAITADLNRDGLPDVIAAGPATLAVRLATGARTSAAPILQNLGATAYNWSLTAGDVNGDGKLDIVAAEGNLIVLIGNGDGTFKPPATYLSTPLRRPIIADLNGDSAPDIVGIDNQYLSYLTGKLGPDGKATGQLNPFVHLKLPGGWARGVKLADINGDSRPDIVVAALIPPGGSLGGLFVGLNTTGATDTTDQPFDSSNPKYFKLLASANSFLDVAVQDLDGDGKLDLLGVEERRTNSPIFLQTAAGTGDFPITPSRYQSLGADYTSVVVADVIGDSKNELIFSGEPAASVRENAAVLSGIPLVRSNVALGIQAVWLRITDSVRPNALAYGLTPFYTSSYSYLSMLFSGGAGFEGVPNATSGESGTTFAALAPFQAADGTSYIAAADQAKSTVRLFKATPDGALALAPVPNSFPTGASPSAMATADLNSDGAPDLLVGNYGSQNLSLLLGDFFGRFSPAVTVPLSRTLQPLSLATGDFNGDGKLDAAVLANDRTDPLKVFLVALRNNGTGMLIALPEIPVDKQARTLLLADLDGDNRTELIVTAPSANRVQVWRLNPMIGFEEKSVASAGEWPVGLHVMGDSNGDGKPELVVVNESAAAGAQGNVRVLLSNPGTGISFTDRPELAFTSCTLPNQTLSGDVTGDGSADLLISCWGDFDTSLWTDQGNGFLGESFTKLRRYDFTGPMALYSDGDGRPDLVTADELKGRIYTLKGK